MSLNLIKKEDCSGCFGCYNACPKHCISMEADEEGFWYPKIDEAKCVNCGLCEKSCPIISGKKESDKFETKAYMAVSEDSDIRLQSSSGGIFTLLAKEIIAKKGVVFGAAFTQDFKEVEHIAAKTEEELAKLRMSKYVQSKIGDTYKQAKECLDNKQMVLFTGTPCQIGGLYAFLGKTYENLYTQDIICHGVPSPLVWEKYVEHIENVQVEKIKYVTQRNKKIGWDKSSVVFEFENKKSITIPFSEDKYIKGFLSNIYLRPSCYNCSFKGLNRWSDLTLADFWGINKVCPEFNDNKGVSLVLANSFKGEELFKSISSQIKAKRAPINDAISHNPAALHSVRVHPKRSKFYKLLKKTDVENAVMKTLKPNIASYILRGVKRRVKNIIHK